jgi:hypothetical protein
VLNNFPQDNPALKLMAKVFQNLFPAINVASVLLCCQKCVAILKALKHF